MKTIRDGFESNSSSAHSLVLYIGPTRESEETEPDTLSLDLGIDPFGSKRMEDKISLVVNDAITRAKHKNKIWPKEKLFAVWTIEDLIKVTEAPVIKRLSKLVIPHVKKLDFSSSTSYSGFMDKAGKIVYWGANPVYGPNIAVVLGDESLVDDQTFLQFFCDNKSYITDVDYPEFDTEKYMNLSKEYF